jgi:multiple sugar transport system ATP-binding protein
MIYVTHDQVEAMTLADRIVVLSAGRIEQVGTPIELYEHPDNLFVAGFIGSPRMNFIPAQLVEAHAGGAVVKLDNGTQIRCAVDAGGTLPGEKLTLGVRPEHFRLGERDNAIEVPVTFVESLGGSAQAYCDLPGMEEALTCELDGRVRVHAGDTLTLGIPADATYLFDATGRAFRRLAGAAGQA